ncbi:hypothetical protein J1C47_18700 [Jiella sp. MQZ13P-4]|uniref:Uncharacterized protein n=2 Tax=Jiella sonneratiae TaxID=2816856 RepID=A0ABS3J9S6_9HYPH|nr:hypothetical protein [Jiella sonneratiae]
MSLANRAGPTGPSTNAADRAATAGAALIFVAEDRRALLAGSLRSPAINDAFIDDAKAKAEERATALRFTRSMRSLAGLAAENALAVREGQERPDAVASTGGKAGEVALARAAYGEAT